MFRSYIDHHQGYYKCMVKLLRLAIVGYFKYDGSMPASIDKAFISKHNVRPLHVEIQVMSITHPLAV